MPLLNLYPHAKLHFVFVRRRGERQCLGLPDCCFWSAAFVLLIYKPVKVMALWLRTPINMLLIHRALGMHSVYAWLRYWMELLYMFKMPERKQECASAEWQEGFRVCILVHVVVVCYSKCDQLCMTVKLVRMTACVRVGFETHVCVCVCFRHEPRHMFTRTAAIC